MGKISEETIKMWEGKYRKVKKIEINDDGEIFTGWFRRPDMETISIVSKLSKTDEIRAANALFDNCWLGGDELIKEDAMLKLAATAELNKIMEGIKAELKN
jgi:hypothetical protein